MSSHEAWVQEHGITAHIEAAIAQLLKIEPRPADPCKALGRILLERAKGAEEPAVEAHQAGEVNENVAALRACAAAVTAKMGAKVRCVATADTATPPPGAKLVHFIRHGEGHHNVAQREWRADPAWDGKTEPYTLETDPDMKYVDAELNDKGRGQAQDLTSRTEPTLRPQLIVCAWPNPLTLR